MARMFPETGPVKETTSPAERHLYETLQALSDDYLVFHAPAWQHKDKDGRVRNGEVDFIVVHRSYSLLLLEVKGGDIYYDGTAREWWSRDRKGDDHSIKDPFLQVRESVHVLAQHLRRVQATKPYTYRLAYGVWFPDVEWPRRTVSLPHVSDEVVLDATSLHDPEGSLLSIYKYHEQWPSQKHHTPLSEDALVALEDVLAPTLRIIGPLSVQLSKDETQIARLTDEQFAQLDRLSRHRRIAVRGGAGTGKTVIAIEKARRLANQGLNVLVVCRNQPLALWIEAQLPDKSGNVRPNVQVAHLEQLCVGLAAQAGEPYELSGALSQQQLATQLSRIIGKLEAVRPNVGFDAILVDEGQNIERPIWQQLQRLLRDRKDGYFYVFYDPAQRDLDEDWIPPIGSSKFDLVLTTNCRNTRAIFQLARRFYTGLEEMECHGPEGHAIEYRDPTSLANSEGRDKEEVALEQTLNELISGGGVRPEEILIITCRVQPRSDMAKNVTTRWYTRKSVGRHKLTWHSEGTKSGHVSVSTIRSAQGLERKVVILSELDGLDHEPKRDKLLYTALSRAMSHLIILGTEDQLRVSQPSLRQSSKRSLT